MKTSRSIFLLLLLALTARAELSGVKTLLDDLGKFAVVEDVTLDDVTMQFDWIALQGPLAAQAGEAVFGPENNGGVWRDHSENDCSSWRSAAPP